jgi:branched-chain amino acid transport system permease protein
MEGKRHMDVQDRLEVTQQERDKPGERTMKRRYELYILYGLIAVLVGSGLLLFPQITTDQYSISLAYTLFIFVALAQSWNLVGGYTGLVSLGQAAFFGLGAYTTAILLTRTDLPFFVAVLASGLVATAFATAISLPVFRFRGIYFAIGTLILAEALRIWMINWSLTGGAEGINLPLANIPDLTSFYYIGLAIAAAATGIIALILHTKLGIGLRAIRDNEDAAQNMGVSTFRVKLYAFAISAFIAGLAGGVQAVYLGTIEPYSIFSINWTITAVNTVIVGGIGTLFGPIVGAVFETILSEALKDYGTIHLIITGLILILVIRFLPAGIWGQLSNRAMWQGIVKAVRRKHVART